MALGTTLPLWPALIFTYLEPLSLIIGYYTIISDPSAFVHDQIASSTPTSLIPASPGAQILSYSIGNIFLLLAGLAVLCTVITREARVTKWYLGMVALGDLGHIYASYRVIGPEVFWDYKGWNGVMAGNIGVSAFLHVHRVATILGVFGRVGRR